MTSLSKSSDDSRKSNNHRMRRKKDMTNRMEMRRMKDMTNGMEMRRMKDITFQFTVVTVTLVTEVTANYNMILFFATWELVIK